MLIEVNEFAHRSRGYTIKDDYERAVDQVEYNLQSPSCERVLLLQVNPDSLSSIECEGIHSTSDLRPLCLSKNVHFLVEAMDEFINSDSSLGEKTVVFVNYEQVDKHDWSLYLQQQSISHDVVWFEPATTDQHLDSASLESLPLLQAPSVLSASDPFRCEGT